MDPYTDNKELDDYIDARLEVIPPALKEAAIKGAVLQNTDAYLSQLQIPENERIIIVYKVFLILLQLYSIDDLETEILADTEIEIDLAIKIAAYIKNSVLVDLLPHLENLPDEPFDESRLSVSPETSMEEILGGGGLEKEETPTPSVDPLSSAPQRNIPTMPPVNSVSAPSRAPQAATVPPAVGATGWKHVSDPANSMEGSRTMPTDLAAAKSAAEGVTVPHYGGEEDQAEDNSGSTTNTIPSYQKPLTKR